jgi:hypothetical protein
VLKVYRIISIEHADTGRHIATRDDQCTAAQALEGIADSDAAMANASRNRTQDAARLYPREAWTLIETVKAILKRHAPAAAMIPADIAGELPF